MVTPALLSEYYEALELFLYERVSLARIEHQPSRQPSALRASSSGAAVGTSAATNSSSSSGGVFDAQVAKLLLMAIGAVAKLAARCQDLASRVMLCLTKLLKQREFFHRSVLQLANDSIQLLKCPR